MVALADWSDDEGRSSAHETDIAAKLRLSSEKTRMILDRLSGAGYLHVLRDSDRFAAIGAHQEFQINLARLARPRGRP
jgi:DNA-binding MarR family transcriptional regulator